MKETLKAYIDLTRAHFFFVWPILFCSGLMLAFGNYGGFSWQLTIKAALIALFGFEAGLVLNDYVDRRIDKKDIEFDKLTRYWRPFKKRPIPSGQITPESAIRLFLILVLFTTILISTLPYPNSLYVFAIMVYSYSVEYFYQVRKRDQKFPFAQIVGRTDLSLFPVAGYLCYGSPDSTAIIYFIFFYPWTLAHLAVNDMIDIKNDKKRGTKTITVLYGMKGTAGWISLFTLIHLIAAPFFLAELGTIAKAGFIAASIILIYANYVIYTKNSSKSALKVLPIFHLSMLIYAVSIILDYGF